MSRNSGRSEVSTGQYYYNTAPASGAVLPEYRVYMFVGGDAGVGKTTLAQHAKQGYATSVHASTIGLDYVALNSFSYTLARPAGAHTDVQIFLVDAAGDPRFAPTIASYYRAAQVLLLVYDVTQWASFESLARRWWPELRDGMLNRGVITVIGNKLDLAGDDAREEYREAGFTRRAVSTKEGRAFAESIRAQHFFECSAMRWDHAELLTPIHQAACEVVQAMVDEQLAAGATKTPSSPSSSPLVLGRSARERLGQPRPLGSPETGNCGSC